MHFVELACAGGIRCLAALPATCFRARPGGLRAGPRAEEQGMSNRACWSGRVSILRSMASPSQLATGLLRLESPKGRRRCVR
jgi:hypothetical protein